MPLNVKFTPSARQDLRTIRAYIAQSDSPERADCVVAQIVHAALSLNENPLRGSYPPELLALGVRNYRQLHFKPFRILYRVLGQTVHISIIVDGRRDMQSLLAKRVTQA
jgi:toxin ParE1/3/4